MSILGYLLLPMQHSPSGRLTSFHREIGSSRLGMVQVPLEEGIQSRNEKKEYREGMESLSAGTGSPGCIGLRQISGYTLVSTRVGFPSSPGQHLGSCTERRKAESTPIHPLSHVVFHRPLVISYKILSFPGKGGTAFFFLLVFPRQRVKQHRCNSIFSPGEL